MGQRFTAIYRNGALIPLQPLALAEEAQIDVEISDSNVTPPQITDPEERERVWQRLFERWDRHPLTGVAGRYTREELHERR